MKRFSLLTAALVAAGLSVAPTHVSAQEASKSAAASPVVGVIDLAYIFKNYDRFKDQTASLEAAAKDAEGQMKAFMEKGQKLQQQAATFQQGSAEFNKIEGEMIELKSQMEGFKQKEQREIVRKQAEVYKQIYVEVQDAVNKYAKYYDYKLIIRFNRAEVADSSNPQAIMQTMNRQVVYYQDQDDITEPILKYLNESYRTRKDQAAK
ncbi:OmpH family outer membrane protein [Planctomicrobium sp. SH664]|uniref:OmpH family outer membrane protein n=1 Tax=Planctomicrobium sp. SH664 TaxID=3448125 RepID=UPI003F5C0A80